MTVSPESSPTPAEKALLRALPPSPARVWAGGVAPQEFAARLGERGYEVGQVRAGWRFEPQSPVPGVADVVAWFDVDAGFDSLTLFYRSWDLLRPDGVLVLSNAAARQLSMGAVQGESLEQYMAGLAERNGFRVETAPADDAADGPLRFVKGAAPRWRIRLAEEADVPALRALFRDVFGQDISPAFWHWKYGEGRGAGAIALQDGNIVAHYGCIARRILLFGKPRVAYSIGDVMVQSRERAVFTKAGPFFLTATALAEVLAYRAALTAAAEDQPVQGFGFPNERVMRLAERTGLYVEVGRMVSVHWTPLATRPRLTTRVRALGTPLSSADAGTVDGLWADMRAELTGALVPVRDARHLRERYLEHPEHRYEVMLVSGRFSRAALGVFVVRREEGKAELVDVIAARRNLGAVITQARRMCARWGVGELFCWITQPYAPLFTATGGVEKPLDVRVPSSRWVRSPDPDATVDRIRDRWFLMSGDTDFR